MPGWDLQPQARSQQPHLLPGLRTSAFLVLPQPNFPCCEHLFCSLLALILTLPLISWTGYISTQHGPIHMLELLCGQVQPLHWPECCECLPFLSHGHNSTWGQLLPLQGLLLAVPGGALYRVVRDMPSMRSGVQQPLWSHLLTVPAWLLVCCCGYLLLSVPQWHLWRRVWPHLC